MTVYEVTTHSSFFILIDSVNTNTNTHVIHTFPTPHYDHHYYHHQSFTHSHVYV